MRVWEDSFNISMTRIIHDPHHLWLRSSTYAHLQIYGTPTNEAIRELIQRKRDKTHSRPALFVGVTRMHESCHAYTWVTKVWEDSFNARVTRLMHNPWLIHDSFVWDMTLSYGTWLVHMWHESFIWDMTYSYGTWLIRMGDDSFILYQTHSWPMTHSYGTWLFHMGHGSFWCVAWIMSCGTWLIRMRNDSFTWDRTHSWPTSFVGVPYLLL